MAAIFQWCESNGAGQTVSESAGNGDWKDVDDTTTPPASAPIIAGKNSYVKYQFGKFSGTYTSLSGGRFSHASGQFVEGVTLVGQPTMTRDGDRLLYRKPSTNADGRLTNDMTEPLNATYGVRVWFGPESPASSGKEEITESNPAYTNYLVTQIRTTRDAVPGASHVVLVLQYDEK